MKLRYIVVPLLGVSCWAMANWEHGFAHLLGIDTQQSQFYDFVSGVGPMIVTVLMGAGVIYSVVQHINCHVTGCLRVGKYPLAGGEYKVCRRHHPEDAIRTGRDVLAFIHEQHQRHKRQGIIIKTP